MYGVYSIPIEHRLVWVRFPLPPPFLVCIKTSLSLFLPPLMSKWRLHFVFMLQFTVEGERATLKKKRVGERNGAAVVAAAVDFNRGDDVSMREELEGMWNDKDGGENVLFGKDPEKHSPIIACVRLNCTCLLPIMHPEVFREMLCVCVECVYGRRIIVFSLWYAVACVSTSRSLRSSLWIYRKPIVPTVA